MFLTVFAIFLAKIAMRYFWGFTPAWPDEISVILFMWMVFWAATFVVRAREQITFDLVVRPAGPRLRRWMGLARALLIGGFFAAGLPGSISYLLFLWRERTPVLDLREDWIYSIFICFMLSVVVRYAISFLRLLGSDWRREI